MKLLLLSGMPFSKRDKYAQSLSKEWTIISREVSRMHLYGYDKSTSNEKEVEINKDVNFRLKKGYLSGLDMCYNLTNCAQWMLDRIIAECPASYEIEVRFFDCSIWKVLWGNLVYWAKYNKWIPIDVLRQLKKGYDAINKEKYRHYSEKLGISQQKW